MKISIDQLYYLCNTHRWFTNSDRFQYDLLFHECKSGASLERLATISTFVPADIPNRTF